MASTQGEELSVRREDIVARVRTVLCNLERTSETRAAKAPGDRVSGSRETPLPYLERTTFDHFFDKLERWCEEAERRSKEDRVRQEAPMTQQQYDFWFFETYAGKKPAIVADAENMTPDAVRKKRERAGRDPKTGHPRD